MSRHGCCTPPVGRHSETESTGSNIRADPVVARAESEDKLTDRQPHAQPGRHSRDNAKEDVFTDSKSVDAGAKGRHDGRPRLQQVVETTLVCVVVIVVWALLSLPIIFYHLNSRKVK